MSEQKINFSDYKSSGVYFLEYDNTVVSTANTQTALRLAVGFNMTGPFNRPVYVENATDINELFGSINRKLERKGCYTNRNLRTMVRKNPVYALNLLPVNTAESSESSTNTDTVGFSFLSFDPTKNNIDGSALYADMYDRSRFWVADDQAFVNNCFVSKTDVANLEHAPLFGVANCGTKDISLIIRKAENLTGYNVTFLDWYGSESAIPYKWVRPYDLISDYFVDVYAVSGRWDASTYATYAQDPTWSTYFTTNGLKKDMLNKFLRLDAVNVIGGWTGFLFPEFTDKQGNPKSIDYIINKYCNKNGFFFSINNPAIETVALAKDSTDGKFKYFLDLNGDGKYVSDPSTYVAHYLPDLVGNGIDVDASTTNYNLKDFLSYHFPTDASASIFTTTCTISGNEFTVTGNASNISVGDFVRDTEGLMARITKKRVTASSTVFTATAPIAAVSPAGTAAAEIHKQYADIYTELKLIPLDGLLITSKLMPGFDASGNVNLEAGVEKIYNMLEDEGIRRGLLNRDIVDYRYVVDTLGFGLKDQCGAKVHLTKLARDKGSCTAICSVPSMSQFAESDKPFFGNTYTSGMPRPTFNVKYIAEGGNPDMVYDADTEMFSLPDEGNGAQFCGFFAPYLKYTEGTQTILIPPAADVSNTFMNKYLGGNPYVTVANLNGLIAGEPSDVEYMFDTQDRDALEPFGINPIIKRNGAIMIYGDRTAYQTVNSDLSFLHVRELLNLIEAQCRAVLDNYVFTYNTATTRAEIVSRLNPILSAMKDSDALAKYEIQCDDVNNTKDVIDEKFCIVDIGVWINQNMEKIVTRITLNRSTTA